MYWETKAAVMILVASLVEKKAVSPAAKKLPARERKEAAAKWRSISAQYPFIRILSFP